MPTRLRPRPRDRPTGTPTPRSARLRTSPCRCARGGARPSGSRSIAPRRTRRRMPRPGSPPSIRGDHPLRRRVDPVGDPSVAVAAATRGEPGDPERALAPTRRSGADVPQLRERPGSRRLDRARARSKTIELPVVVAQPRASAGRGERGRQPRVVGFSTSKVPMMSFVAASTSTSSSSRLPLTEHPDRTAIRGQELRERDRDPGVDLSRRCIDPNERARPR